MPIGTYIDLCGDPTPSLQLIDYRMTRVTFGVSATAFAAIKSLQQTAHDHSQDYPIATSHAYKSFYIVDCLAGADTQKEALELYQQLRSLLLKSGFYASGDRIRPRF